MLPAVHPQGTQRSTQNGLRNSQKFPTVPQSGHKRVSYLENKRQDATRNPLKYRNFSDVSPEKFTLHRFPPFWAQPGGAAAITQRCSFRGGWDGNWGNIQGGHCIPSALGAIPGPRCPSHRVPKPAAGWQPNKGGRGSPARCYPRRHHGGAAVGDRPSQRHQIIDGDPPRPARIRCPKSGAFPRPPRPRSRPQRPARAEPLARASPQGCGAAAEGPRGRRAPPQTPPPPPRLPLPSRRSNSLKEQRQHLPGFPALAAAAPDKDHARARLMSARLPRRTGSCAPPPGPSRLPARAPLTKRAGRDASFWRLSGHGAPPHPSAPSSGHTVPSLGGTASTRLPCGSFSQLSAHGTALRLSSPLLTPTSMALPLRPHPPSIAVSLSPSTLTHPIPLNGFPSSRYIRPSTAGTLPLAGREEGEGRLGQEARWNDIPSSLPTRTLRAAARTPGPPRYRRGPSPLSLQGRSSASLPLVRSRRAQLRSGLLSFSRVRPARAAALLRRRERRARRCLRPGSAAPAAGLGCPASRGGSLAPSSLNFASLRAASAPPHRMHRRCRSPPRPGKGSAALPPHALPRCRDGRQLPAQDSSPGPASGGRDRDRPHQSAPVRPLFWSNPLLGAEIPSAGPGCSKPRSTI